MSIHGRVAMSGNIPLVGDAVGVGKIDGMRAVLVSDANGKDVAIGSRDGDCVIFIGNRGFKKLITAPYGPGIIELVERSRSRNQRFALGISCCSWSPSTDASQQVILRI